MPGTPAEDTIFSFGPFILHVTARRLTNNNKSVPLGARAFDILLALVEHRGQLQTKEMLIGRVWPNTRVAEDNLKTHVSALRRALDDDGTKYIVTVPGRGYSFVAPVSISLEPADVDATFTNDLITAPDVRRVSLNSIRIGILHSLTGTTAQSELPIVDASLLAVDEINKTGGVLGRTIEPLVLDCESDEVQFARQAEKIILTEAVYNIFGCLTSASRKQIVPVVERHNALLMYPMQYEGLEQSPNVFYLGAAPNQQILPAVKWAFAFLQRRRFFLIGWDSVYSHATNAILRDEIDALGGQVVGEKYVHIAGLEIGQAAQAIADSKPDIILNSIVGDINAVFCHALRAAGIRAAEVPTIYFSISENELKGIPSRDSLGDYAVFSYFQSLDRPENRAFVASFQSRYGSHRVTSDPMEAGYIGVHFWARAVAAAKSYQAQDVRKALLGDSFNAPSGVVRIDQENQHTWKTMRIAEIVKDGQFSVLWSSERPIRPEPYPKSRSIVEWEQLLADLHAKWNGRWTRAIGA